MGVKTYQQVKNPEKLDFTTCEIILTVSAPISVLSARDFLPWLCCACVCLGIYVSLTLFIKYRRSNRVIGYTAVCVAILNIALNAWLLGTHGIVGAAQATLCVYITASIILMCGVVRRYKLPWFRIL